MVSEVAGKQQLPTGSRYRNEIRKQAQEILSRSSATEGCAWGWKLPETILVLPLFLDAFPDAKIIHFVRHPISSSLRRSHITSRLGNPVGDVILPAAYEYAGRGASSVTADPIYLHNAYSWNYQVTRAMQYGRNILGTAQYMELKYEDLCTNLRSVFSAMALFLKMPIKQSLPDIEINEQPIQQQWHEDNEACKVWEICGPTAEALGYSKGC
jgi:hypothetical protein